MPLGSWFGNLVPKKDSWLLLAAFLLLPASAPAQTWNWKVEDVDVAGMGSSIAVDQDGNLHVSYYVPDGGRVKYGFRPAGGTKWFNMELEHNLGVLETGITLDSVGNPHICYTPRIMKYAHWDGRKWSKQEVDPGSGLIAYICSIKVASDGKPMITWYLESGTFLRYAILQDGLWVARSLDGDALPGKWSSMVLDANGNPRVSYSHFPLGQLKYAVFDGKNWSTQMVDAFDPMPNTGGQKGMGNSLVLDAHGNPIISYYDDESLKLARYSDGKWKKEVVEALPPFGKWGWKSFRSSLVLDSKGNPHIGFESLQGLEHAWWDGKQWRTQILSRALGITFCENSMTIDKDDTLYMTYRDPVDGSLRLAVGRSSAAPETAQADKLKGSN